MKPQLHEGYGEQKCRQIWEGVQHIDERNCKWMSLPMFIVFNEGRLSSMPSDLVGL